MYSEKYFDIYSHEIKITRRNNKTNNGNNSLLTV